jgi:hypothetical protein
MPNNLEIPQQPEGGNIDELLAQLSPEELEHLASSLSADMQNPGAHEGGDNVAGLAQAIEAHLAQNPEASVPEAPAEKAAALEFVKSASYIRGFLTQAVEAGANLKQAVDLYDNALTETIDNLKTAKLHGKQHKLDVNKDGKISGSDLAELRHEKSETPKQEKQEHMKDHMEEIKTAAYYEGVFERAREYGFNDRQTVNLLKSAVDFTEAVGEEPSVTPQIAEVLKRVSPANAFGAASWDEAGQGFNDATDAVTGYDEGAVSPQSIVQNLKGLKDVAILRASGPISRGGEALHGFADKMKSLAGDPKTQLAAAGLLGAGVGAGGYALGRNKKEKQANSLGDYMSDAGQYGYGDLDGVTMATNPAEDAAPALPPGMLESLKAKLMAAAHSPHAPAAAALGGLGATGAGGYLAGKKRREEEELA